MMERGQLVRVSGSLKDWGNMENIQSFSDLKLHITNVAEIKPCSLNEVRDCEQKISHQFEQEYIDFVTQFGIGIFGGSYVRLYSPKEIASQHKEWLERVNEYYFWTDGADVLNKEQVLQAVAVGDTLSGDEMIYVAGEYYILPRDEEIIYPVGKTCSKAIKWQLENNISSEPDEETGT